MLKLNNESFDNVIDNGDSLTFERKGHTKTLFKKKHFQISIVNDYLNIRLFDDDCDNNYFTVQTDDSNIQELILRK